MQRKSFGAVAPPTAAGTLLIVVLASSSAAQALPPEQSADPPATHWRFNVLLDGKPIGEHEFTVVRNGPNLDVRTTAHFKVRVAMIPVYHYEHEDHEKWTHGCLSEIDARTDDNGKKSQVRGTASAGKLVLSSPAGGTDESQDCVRTFAYWDRSTLQSATRLLNSGTGQYTPARLEQHGSEQISVNNRSIAAEHDSLQTNKFAIELWYSASGAWVALQTQTEGGHTLRYEAQ